MNIDRDSLAQPLIRFGFVFAGILAFYISIANFLPNLTAMSMVTMLESRAESLSFMLSATIAPILLLTISFVMIRFSARFANKLLPSESVESQTLEAAIYRVAFTVSGVLVLSWALPRIAQILSNIAAMKFDAVPENMHADLTESNWISLIYFCIQCGIAVYLIWGAPHLVKWQVNRSSNSQSAT